ncbi:MAG TPA: hypothetical protein VGS96_12115, partial [Thermoanaerobaculia bacterium]|nr:hypothetical protein [Thermoanaerobaculia bacterium]
MALNVEALHQHGEKESGGEAIPQMRPLNVFRFLLLAPLALNAQTPGPPCGASLSISLSGPTHTTLTATGTTTTDCATRDGGLFFLDGEIFPGHPPVWYCDGTDALNCVQRISTSVACFAKGEHVVEFDTSCDTKGTDANGNPVCGSSTGPKQYASFTVDDPKPSLTLILTGPDANGVYTASATYAFPSTESAGQRYVSIKFNGATVTSEYPVNPTGTTPTGTFSGCGTLVAVAESCGRTDA